MVVAGSLPPWVMQLGRNRKKIILPPKNTSKNLISIVGYVLAEEKIFLLPEGYLSHCPILSLPCRPNMQCFISCPCAQTTASRIQPHLLKHSFCQMSPMHTRADWDIPAGACLSEIPFCSSTGPQTAKVLFAWKKKKKGNSPPSRKTTHTQEKNIWRHPVAPGQIASDWVTCCFPNIAFRWHVFSPGWRQPSNSPPKQTFPVGTTALFFWRTDSCFP